MDFYFQFLETMAFLGEGLGNEKGAIFSLPLAFFFISRILASPGEEHMWAVWLGESRYTWRITFSVFESALQAHGSPRGL